MYLRISDSKILYQKTHVIRNSYKKALWINSFLHPQEVPP